MINKMLKKSLVCVVIVLLIGVNIVSGINIQLKNTTNPRSEGCGNILYVGGSGPDNYTRIQDAVDNSSDGDTVFVYSGIYYENVAIYTSIDFIGEDKNTTIIDGGGVRSVVRFRHDYITISGFTLQNSGNKPETNSGVEISTFEHMSDFCSITNNIIMNNWDGIHSVFSNGCLISKNIIMNNRNHGIYLRACCYYYNITYNIIKNNNENGMVIYEEDNFIFRNIVENNYIGIYTSNDAVENIIKNNHNGIIAGDCKVYRNIVADNDIGIFEFGVRTQIKDNNLLNNDLHVTFEDFFPLFLLPLIFFPLAKWEHNYYEGHGSNPKIIRGTMIIFTIRYELQFEIGWINIDLHPAKKPNDLDWLKEEIRLKI